MIPLLVAVVLIVLNGVFVAAEFALLTSMRSRIQPMAEAGRFGARGALRSMRDIGPTLAATQLGVTIASLALGSVAEPAVGSIFEHVFSWVDLNETASRGISLVLALSVVVFFHLLVGEMIPKSLALAAPERVLVGLIAPVRALAFVTRPLIWLLNQMARFGARLFGAAPADELRSAHTAAEIGLMVEESRDEGFIDDDEVTLLAGALAFVGRSVSEVMVPAERVETVGLDDTVASVEESVRRSGHSRVLVRGERAGSILGFVHAKSLLALPSVRRSDLLPRELLRLTFSVPPTKELGDVLVRMRATRRHLAVVIDDDRNMIGLVTLEDVLESIVGDIVDETDR